MFPKFSEIKGYIEHHCVWTQNITTVNTIVVSVVIRKLRMVSGNLASHQEKIGVTSKIETLKKAALLGTERLL